MFSSRHVCVAALLLRCALAPAHGPRRCEAVTPAAGTLHYELYGTDDPSKPVLVMIPGNGNDSSSFYGVVPRLIAHYRVLLVDPPGHGKSGESASDDYSAAAMARPLAGLLERLRLDRVILLGHSLGARTAAAFLDRFPERVDRLVIEDMELRARPRSACAEGADRRARQIRRALDRDFPSRDAMERAVRAAIAFVDETALRRFVDERACRRADGAWRLAARPWVYERHAAATGFTDFNPVLERHRDTPVLVMRSDERADRASISEEGLAEMRRAGPGLRYERFPGSTHSIHRSQPARFVASLLAFTHGGR